jgi:transaldolase
MPSVWQKRFNASSVEVRERIGDPIDEGFLADLRTLPDFVRAFEPDGLSEDDFDSWGPTVKTLRAFIGSYHDLLHLVGEALLA